MMLPGLHRAGFSHVAELHRARTAVHKSSIRTRFSNITTMEIIAATHIIIKIDEVKKMVMSVSVGFRVHLIE